MLLRLFVSQFLLYALLFWMHLIMCLFPWDSMHNCIWFAESSSNFGWSDTEWIFGGKYSISDNSSYVFMKFKIRVLTCFSKYSLYCCAEYAIKPSSLHYFLLHSWTGHLVPKWYSSTCEPLMHASLGVCPVLFFRFVAYRGVLCINCLISNVSICQRIYGHHLTSLFNIHHPTSLLNVHGLVLVVHSGRSSGSNTSSFP